MGSIDARRTPAATDRVSSPRFSERLLRLRARHRGLAEVALLAALYGVYSMTRSFADHTFAAASDAADTILRLERPLHLDVELALNEWVMRSEGWSVAASFWYASAHFVVTGGMLVLLFRRRPAVYSALRNTLVLATVIALGFFYLIPTAPPRLVDGPIQDMLAATADHGWWGAHASAPRGMADMTNELAAFPSMHAGWSLWVAIAVFAATRSRAWRAVGVAYALTTALDVLVTGNHWTLDILAGWVVVALAAAVCLGRRGRAAAGEDAVQVRLAGEPSGARPGPVEPAQVPVGVGGGAVPTADADAVPESTDSLAAV